MYIGVVLGDPPPYLCSCNVFVYIEHILSMMYI